MSIAHNQIVTIESLKQWYKRVTKQLQSITKHRTKSVPK